MRLKVRKEKGLSTVRPVFYVVSVDEISVGAARETTSLIPETTSLIPETECAADCRGDRAGFSAN